MKSHCRFCAAKYENLLNIFQEVKFNDFTLQSPVTLVKQVFREIDFPPDDELARGICLLCLNTLKMSYDFYEKVKKSQDKLKEILNQQKVEQTNILSPILLPKENKNSVKCKLNKTHDTKRIYQCFECTDNFKSLRKLNGHIEKTHTKKYICIYCNCYYPEPEMTDHIKTEHINSKYFCRLCSENFSSQRFLFKHLKNIHNYATGCFYCTKCDYLQFSDRGNLLKHINVLHPGDCIEILPIITNNNTQLCSNIDQNEFVPPSQDELIMDVEFLDDFFLNQDENSFQFNDCWEALGLNFEDELKLKFSDLTNDSMYGTTVDISKSMENDNLYKCPHCHDGFASQFKMFIHLGQIHNKNSLVCNECGVKFSKFNEFVEHRKQHFREFFISQQPDQQNDEPLQHIKNNKKIYVCKNCKRKYKLKNNYLIHICKKQKKPIKITCNFCNLNFSNIKELYAHQKCNHRNSTLQCSLCDKYFKTLPGLKYHLKTHEGIKSFICPYCNQQFLANVNLSAHIKAVHTVKKSHLCDLCDRRFATLDHLKKHVMSVHQKERNHLCSVCGGCFSQVSHLKQHSEIHKEKRKFHCEYCSKGFTRRIDFRFQYVELILPVTWTDDNHLHITLTEY